MPNPEEWKVVTAALKENRDLSTSPYPPEALAFSAIRALDEHRASLQFQYDGYVYVRPVSRGVVMLDLPTEPHVEDCVPDGYYRMQIAFKKLSEEETELMLGLRRQSKPPEDTG